MNRRDFLKILGVGGAGAGLGALFRKATNPPGAKLIPYLIPPEDNVPGIATWYASLCAECGAGCGVLVKVMDGRAKKIEGNPLHPVNKGKLCARGQASLQGLYNPDRIKGPLKRRGERGKGEFEEISWDEGLSILAKNLAELARSAEAGKMYLLTAPIRGHRRLLVNDFMGAYGSPNWFQYELFDYRNLAFANQASMGVNAIPYYDVENTRYLLSFGADFSATWLSPVNLSYGYGQMRQGRGNLRGRLVQVEPRLSLTGAVADEWVPARPGTEGILALSMAYAIAEKRLARSIDAGNWKALLSSFRPAAAAKATDVPEDKIYRLAHEFASAHPSLAIGGESISSYENGVSCLVAVNILNHVAGNIGVKGGVVPNVEYLLRGEARHDFKRNVAALVSAADAGKVKSLVVCNANPVFTTPKAMKTEEALRKVPFIASLSNYMDETTVMADLILPAHHTLEDWGDDFTEPAAGVTSATIMQPAVTPYFNTMGLGDIIISLSKGIGGRVRDRMPRGAFLDYLKDSWKDVYSRNRGGAAGAASFDEFWNGLLAAGGFFPETAPKIRPGRVSMRGARPHLAKEPSKFEGDDKEFPFYLLVYPHPRHLDGRGANSPWLQEIPDAMTSIVWGSWVEMNPKTAETLGIKEGDLVSVESPFGRISAPVYYYPAIRPDTIAIPVGQGHAAYGRYAKGRGVNPIEILPAKIDKETGALALNSTRARVARVSPDGKLSKLEGTARELGRGIVKTISPEELKKTGKEVV